MEDVPPDDDVDEDRKDPNHEDEAPSVCCIDFFDPGIGEFDVAAFDSLFVVLEDVE